jgi:hypothetical protein
MASVSLRDCENFGVPLNELAASGGCLSAPQMRGSGASGQARSEHQAPPRAADRRAYQLPVSVGRLTTPRLPHGNDQELPGKTGDAEATNLLVEGL